MTDNEKLSNPVPPPAAPSGRYDIMVLLVDDQALIGEAVRRVLAPEANIDFHYCADPHAAVQVAEQIKPTVILQDLVMPGIDGLSLLARYRANPATRDVPVIVLSTKEEPTIKSAAFAAGANDYLVKLPDSIELIARIRHHSRAYLNQVQRDEAYRALRESQQQLLEKNLELQRLTNVDGLTGLSNRRFLNEHLAVEWNLAIRQGSCLSLLMVDVDDFKRYNDAYGHLAGDEVLKKVADALAKTCERPGDVAARFGGEEFAVVLPRTGLDDARAMGEKMVRRVAELGIPHKGSSVGGHATISVGLASAYPKRGDAFLPLIAVADEALYQAKRAGKNQLVATEAQIEHKPPALPGLELDE